jgi:hypothetical protein
VKHLRNLVKQEAQWRTAWRQRSAQNSPTS